MIIEKKIIIHKSIHDAWNVLGVDFANPSRWASAVNHSEGGGTALNGSSCSERGCATTMGRIREKLLTFSQEKHSLSYEMVEGIPHIVKYATNQWTLIELKPGQCTLQMIMNIQLKGFGRWLEPILKSQMSKMGTHLIEDFAFYVEKGRPHPRKIKTQRA
jgi:hypothetical protein